MENSSDWAQLDSHTFAKQEIPCSEDDRPFIRTDQISSTTTGITANSLRSTMNHMSDTNNMSSRDNFHLSYTADGRVSKPSRKRTRVSAKKDDTTTILNTDINNFRAMVQQFTGAPQSALLSMSSVPLVNLSENYSCGGMSYDQQAGHPHHQQQQLMIQLLNNNNNHRNDGFGLDLRKHVAAKMERSDGFVIADTNNSSRSTTTTSSSSSTYEMFPPRLSSFDHHENRSSNGFVSF